MLRGGICVAKREGGKEWQARRLDYSGESFKEWERGFLYEPICLRISKKPLFWMEKKRQRSTKIYEWTCLYCAQVSRQKTLNQVKGGDPPGGIVPSKVRTTEGKNLGRMWEGNKLTHPSTRKSLAREEHRRKSGKKRQVRKALRKNE